MDNVNAHTAENSPFTKGVPKAGDLPDLYTAEVLEDVELALETEEDYRATEQWHKRTGRFTASEDYRLMAGIDMTEEDRIKALENALNKPELVTLAEQYGCVTVGTKADLAARIYPHLPQVDELPQGAITYVKEKVIETKTGKPIETYESYHMRRGKELEGPTVEQFEKVTGLKVECWGKDQLFLEDVEDEDLKGHVGATPDGRVEISPPSKGVPEGRGMFYGFEGKAPAETTHYDYLYGSPDGKVPPLTKDTLKKLEPGYWYQIIKGLWLSGWAGWYFVSFHPDFPEEEKILIIRIDRCDALEDIEKLKKRSKMAVAKKIELLNKPLPQR